MNKVYYPEVELLKDFNVVVETCTRMGILSGDVVYQTCHIFHKDGQYFVPHFKELFSMIDFKEKGTVDEHKVHMTDDDFERRNSIIFLLDTWGLIKVKDSEYINNNKGNKKIFIVPFKEKDNYELKNKFTLGKK
jgi:hypothetical protein